MSIIVTSQAKTFWTVSRFYTDSRSPAVHQPFEWTGMPFECLELTVLNNSSSVRTVRAMRSTKLVSRSNGSSYPFEKIHQPFERAELSVRKKLSAVRTARAIRSRKFISRLNGSSYPFKKETVSYFGSRSKKTRRDDFKTINSPFFVKWRMPSCLHYTNSRHASVLCLPPLNDTHFIFYGKTFDSQAPPIKLKTLRSLRVRFLLSEVSSTINEVKAGYKANGPSPREAQ